MRNIITHEWFTIFTIIGLFAIVIAKFVNTLRFNDFLYVIGNSKYLKIYTKDQKFIDQFDSFLFVPQDSFLFSDTIEENIRFGKPEAEYKEIVEVCKIASVHKNIMERRKKYKTIVGERGVTLSGGQKQRICIARAIIKKPRILILDDALSAVDTNTEKEIIKNLARYVKGITTVVISHRISSFIKADNIYVIDKGKVESEGTHQELIKKSKVYKSIYQIQKLEE